MDYMLSSISWRTRMASSCISVRALLTLASINPYSFARLGGIANKTSRLLPHYPVVRHEMARVLRSNYSIDITFEFERRLKKSFSTS